jgi:hypothetical protein
VKEFQVRRTADCPTGEHVQVRDDPDDPTAQIVTTVDCTCPWLVIRESHPVPHMMAWQSAEAVQRLIKEFDEGYFDQQGMPRRARSQFMSPHVSDLLDLIDAGDLVGAAMRLLAQVNADQVRWIADKSTLAIRTPFAGAGDTMTTWLQLTFESGEKIKVDRGELPDIPDTGKLDLSALADIVDGHTPLPAWQLWTAALDQPAMARPHLSEQAFTALTGWQGAPEPEAGWHSPPASAELADDPITVLATGQVIDIQRTDRGIEATAVFPEGVRDLVRSVPLPGELAIGGVLERTPEIGETGCVLAVPPAEGPGTVHGIRPHRYPRNAAEAEEMRAIALSQPMVSTPIPDFGDPAANIHVPPQEGDEHD